MQGDQVDQGDQGDQVDQVDQVAQGDQVDQVDPPPPYGQCPYGNNTFGKGASLTRVSFDMLFYLDILSLAWM